MSVELANDNIVVVRVCVCVITCSKVCVFTSVYKTSSTLQVSL